MKNAYSPYSGRTDEQINRKINEQDIQKVEKTSKSLK